LAVRTLLNEYNKHASTMKSYKDMSINGYLPTAEKQRFKDYTWGNKINIDVDTLDNMIEKHGKPNYIKIDVEGYELYVLKGMTRILSKKPILYIEMIESNFANFSYTSLDLIKFLEKYGYNYTQIDDHNFKFD